MNMNQMRVPFFFSLLRNMRRKKLIVTGFFVLICSAHAFSLDITERPFFFNLGISPFPIIANDPFPIIAHEYDFGNGNSYGMDTFPYVSLAIDFALPIPLTLGVFAGYQNIRQEINANMGYLTIGLNQTTHFLPLALRAAYHFDVAENFDLYVGGAAGAVFLFYTWGGKDADIIDDDDTLKKLYEPLTFLYYEFNAGVKWYFLDFAGIFAEGGYSPLGFLKVGITFRL